VAVAGDTLVVKDGLVWVNGQKEPDYPGRQLTYKVTTTGSRINQRVLEELGLNLSELSFDPRLPGYPWMPLTEEMLGKVKALQIVADVTPNMETFPAMGQDTDIFPFTGKTRWTRDYFGPLWIPEKGATVELTRENLPLYERIIRDYEHNSLQVTAEAILINGEPASEYTFKQDYYFMMGDNRHNSLDSRYWGFVPEDHVVGTPSIIWLSTDATKSFPKSIRWKRFLKIVRNQ
jgi:signal peptidase I